MSTAEGATGILTFLIADVRGYTSFTQAHGDEGAARLADKFAEIAREGVEMHGGQVTELRGDEALAVFSSPRAAVRAAVDLQTVFIDETVVDPSLPLTVGIGIDAGEAVPVQGGYRGGALNLAARLCSKAAAGEVLVSQGMAHLTRALDGVELEPAGEAEVKGISEPVQVFRARTERRPLSTARWPFDLPSALDAVTPIVGREAELRRLRWWWRLARRGAPSTSGTTVVVQGPAGIGKTRLVAELARTVAAGGGACRYTSLAGPGADWTADLSAPGDDDVAALFVVDDIDAMTPDRLDSLSPQVRELARGPRLVVLVLADDDASTEALAAVRRLATDDGHIVRPQPLVADEMLRVAALYVGSAAGEIPTDLLTGTGGVPRRLHEAISEWAHAYASRRLGVLATAAASGRSDLRSVESDLAGTVIDLQNVREQASLFALGPGRRGPEPEVSPYRGLTSFDVGDSDVFFGRERLVATMISRLAGANLLGVVGASGSGKSSAVRAGLLPALAGGVLPGSEGWVVAVARPGEHPLRALDRALWSSLPSAVTSRLDDEVDLAAVDVLLDDGQRLVVVVDQFEEAFTLCRDADERARYLSMLAAAASAPDSRIVVVLAIRADYYGRCAADPTLASLLAANHVLVGPMTAEEYRRAIVQPALRVGATVEPELVDDLVAEVLGEPGALPLLSTTLMELWERREGRMLRRAAALATGGVHGAVARLADAVYEGFTPDQQTIARGVLLRLTGPGIGDSVVRRRVPLSEFDSGSDEVRQVLDTLADRRLVTVSDGTVEVAHEALLREWPRLQAWLDDDREGRRLRSHLAAAANEWAAGDRDAGELYRGARLSAALDWTAQHAAELNEVERDFITESRSVSQQDLVRQQRQNRRLRGLLVGVVGVLVLALVAGGLALVQRQHARTAARVALARQLGAEAVSAPRIDQAMLLAREGVLLDRSDATAGTLLATLLRSPAVLGTFTEPIEARPQQIAVGPDNHTLAVRDNGGNIRFYDTRTRRASSTVLPDAGYTMAYAGPHFCLLAFPPDGDPVIRVYDARSLRLERSLELSRLWVTTPTGQANLLVSDEAGDRLLFAYAEVDPATGTDKRAYVESWDLRTGEHKDPVPLPGVGMTAATMLTGGNLLVTTNDAVVTVDPATLRTVHRRAMSLGQGLGAISSDGQTQALVAGAPDQPGGLTFRLADLRTGRRTSVQGAHTAPIDSIGFTPDGQSVVTTADDGNVDVWSATSGALLETLHGHSGRVLGLAFSRDGRTVYTGGLDGAIFAWDLGGGARFGRPLRVASDQQPEPGHTPALAMSPDSRSFAVRSAAGVVSVLSLATLKPTNRVELPDGVDAISLAWSRDNVLAVGTTPTGKGAAVVQLWDVDGAPHRLRTLTGVDGAATAVAFSPDGSRLAATTNIAPADPADPQSGPTGAFAVWEVASGQPLGDEKLDQPGWSVAWSPDGQRFAVGIDDERIVVADDSGRQERSIVHGVSTQPVSLQFQPDGVLVSGGWSGIVQHWDVDTGRQLSRPVLTEAAPVSGLAIAPSGSQFAVSGGSSGGAKIWDDETLTQFGASFPGGDGTWGNLAYTPNGKDLVVVYDDGTAAVWPVTVDAWMAHACAVAARNFTREEWARFVPDHDYRATCPAGAA